MSNNVFANGREISCKSGDGKTVCEFPDVCMTPPESPATPPGIPVPYPNTALASDTSDGSKSVKISKKEVMLKNKSNFKKSTGDEAGCAAKKGVINSSTKGKAYFISWSDDVKIEGENVVRHLDMTTNNHASPIANGAAPMGHMDAMAISNIPGCESEAQKVKEACTPEEKLKCPDESNLNKAKEKWRSSGKGSKAKADAYAVLKEEYIEYSRIMTESECHRKLKCNLVPKKNNGKPPSGCCPGQTPDHIIDGASFNGMTGYNYDKAPCVCVSGHTSSVGTHGIISNARRLIIKKWNKVNKKKHWNFGQAKKVASKSVALTFPASKCDENCIESQLQAHHEKMVPGIDDSTLIKQKASGKKAQGIGWGEWMKVQKAFK